MENQIITLEEVEQKVVQATTFEQTVAYLTELVAKSKDFVVTDFTDKAQLETLKRYRIDLRKVEIAVEDRGKDMRDIFTKVNKGIFAKQRELTGITSPEIARLAAMEEQAQAAVLRQERLERLPARKERLDALSDGVEAIDDELMEMDSNQFEAYYNKRVADKLEAERLRQEAARKEADAKAAEERRKLDEAADAARKAEQERIDKANRELAEAQAKVDAERKELERQKNEADQKEKDRIAAQEAARAKAEQDKLASEAKAEADKEAAILAELMRPDKEKLIAFADSLDALVFPELTTNFAIKVLEQVKILLIKVAVYIRKNLE